MVVVILHASVSMLLAHARTLKCGIKQKLFAVTTLYWVFSMDKLLFSFTYFLVSVVRKLHKNMRVPDSVTRENNVM